MIEGMSLKPFNSFAIDVLAQHVVMVHTEAELLTQWRLASAGERPVLVLGGGSNVLFLENYEGTVLLNRIRGITVSEDTLAWHLHVGAGEVWHDLVTTCLDCHMPGLENLALIPGYVGSAPIQNIGAYGVELHQLCEYVDVLMLETGKKQRLNAAECHFGYRDSIFKHGLRNNCAIVAVGLRLRKAWQSVLNHGDLSHLDTQHTTPRQIYDAVCTIRRRKLPDLAVTGNAGSFFKNPVIDASMAAKLLSQYPEAPYYPQEPGGGGKVKLAAGWLIDHCGLKGYQLGGAAVHSKQALILINAAQATGGDIAALARYVRQQVGDKFAIWLEPEVRFIGTCGEVDAVGVLS